MATTPRPWTVDPHEPVRKLEDNLWLVRGPIPGMGMPLLRSMTVVRRADGSLVVHSAIPLDPPEMQDLERWGDPAVLIVPNGWHRIDAHAWKARYPAMKVYCPRSQAGAVSKVVAVDGAVEDLPEDAVLSTHVLDGLDKESVLTVRSDARTTLVFCDTFMNVAHLPGFAGAMYRLVGASGGPRVHPFMKWMSKRSLLRAHLFRLAETPELARLIPGHGDPIEQNARDVLREAAATM